MVHLGILFALYCTVNWLDVERLNIKEKANKWGGGSPPSPYFFTLTTDYSYPTLYTDQDAFLYHDFMPSGGSPYKVLLCVEHSQRRRRPSGARGQANAGGARGLEYSLGIRRGQNSKHSKNTIMTLLLLRHDRYKCTYSDVDIKCSSITDNQSLKLSTVYSSLFVDFYKLLAASFADTSSIRRLCITLFWCKCNYELSCRKGHFSGPCAPVQQGQRGCPRCPRGSGAPEHSTNNLLERP